MYDKCLLGDGFVQFFIPIVLLRPSNDTTSGGRGLGLLAGALRFGRGSNPPFAVILSTARVMTSVVNFR